MEKTYHDHENITLKKKRGRPKKIQPTPTPIPPTEQEVLEEWVKDNRPWFFNYNKKTREDIQRIYNLYNLLYDSNKPMGKCGGCHQHVIKTIKDRYHG
jgi:hypothetical protein